MDSKDLIEIKKASPIMRDRLDMDIPRTYMIYSSIGAEKNNCTYFDSCDLVGCYDKADLMNTINNVYNSSVIGFRKGVEAFIVFVQEYEEKSGSIKILVKASPIIHIYVPHILQVMILPLSRYVIYLGSMVIVGI